MKVLFKWVQLLISTHKAAVHSIYTAKFPNSWRQPKNNKSGVKLKQNAQNSQGSAAVCAPANVRTKRSPKKASQEF